jgi:hypothetical protein
MSQDLLFDMNIWRILIGSVVLFLGATQINFFLGHRAHITQVN